ncbi:MAG TPA: hypothetical protein VFA44_01780 [Gaiellaceae bacterium]|nr:hypothetical protein [Gaiellaceae bacterium]
MAIPIAWLKRATLCELRGEDASDLEPRLREVVQAQPARAVFRCALTHLQAQAGREEEARAGGSAQPPSARTPFGVPRPVGPS